jgi:hypothetical protein
LTPYPPLLSQHITEILGPTPAVEPLGGMSTGTTVRLRSATSGDALVLKRTAALVEVHVYTRLAAPFAERGISIPALHGAYADVGGWAWLLLESVPLPFPRERWLAARELLDTLRRLHAIPAAEASLPESRYHPDWPEAQSQQALTLLPERERTALGSTLATVRERCLPLFAGAHLLSGDPNPANWGLRADGTLVLFDWERCCTAAPALDLAISVPGLGTADDFQRVAAAYLGTATGSEVERLSHEIGVAKVWSVVEFLAGVAAGEVQPSFPIDRLVDAFPGWVRNVALRG